MVDTEWKTCLGKMKLTDALSRRIEVSFNNLVK